MRKIRILAVDCHIADIESASFTDAPSFYDYDAVIVNPAKVADLWKGKTYVSRGESVVPWDEYGYAQTVHSNMQHRIIEVAEMMKKDKVLICFLAAQRKIRVAREFYTANLLWVSIYSWLPLGKFPLSTCKGRQISIVSREHPFAQYLEAYKGQLEFKAYSNQPIETTIAVDDGDHPVAFEVRLGKGRIIFIPPPPEAETDSDAEKLKGILVNCIRNSLEFPDEVEPPNWICGYALHGTASLEDKINELEGEISRLSQDKEEHVRNKKSILEYQQLLYQTGEKGLEPVVRKAFRLLGFMAEKDGDYDIVLSSPEGLALAECEGKEKAAINIDKYRQLNDYVDEKGDEGKEYKGILVGNGYAKTDPKDRKDQFTVKAIRRSTERKYCLLCTSELFKAVCRVLELEEDAKLEEIKAAIRNSILKKEGVWKFEG